MVALGGRTRDGSKALVTTAHAFNAHFAGLGGDFVYA